MRKETPSARFVVNISHLIKILIVVLEVLPLLVEPGVLV